MVFIETPIFTRQIQSLMNDDMYGELQKALIFKPDTGDLIKGSGGLRKVRWKLKGTGKSGGVRVIYYWYTSAEQIYMIFAYPKSKQDNLTAEQLAALKAVMQRSINGQ
ncbi:type II toxin-antitoxin system RelE/ParE family toxin [Marinicella gelatinilytica]|uniref:type II toxin-antitoxin system RelE/ParE family toxin n=1 Tax=Marinicella gelatinilytica TaxID=2996017 RepID=UPI002260EC11|nr:type II toxin-antitoxin system RelE/ParE family toxin [Marinicella gelatinilytica]MCX7546298.1 type II toxin-antitoxin system RelE/ParE family toxin [Marinicella gelatinilytica]